MSCKAMLKSTADKRIKCDCIREVPSDFIMPVTNADVIHVRISSYDSGVRTEKMRSTMAGKMD